MGKNIKEISFVLSNDNPIVLDAFDNQYFSKIRGLNTFYAQVIEQRDQVGILWQTLNSHSLILSYYLNQKIKELKQGLNDITIDQLIISGKIYDKQQDVFREIYPDLVCMDYVNFN